MSEVTGVLHEALGGKTYTLRLTMGGIAKLQDLHGQNVAGLLDGTAGDPPRLRPVLDMIAIALEKGHGLPAEEAAEVADDLVTADLDVFARLLNAAFPNAKVEQGASGNVTGPTRAA